VADEQKKLFELPEHRLKQPDWGRNCAKIVRGVQDPERAMSTQG